MGLTIRIHHPLVRTEPTGQGQRRAVAEQSSSEVATGVSSSESVIRKPSSGLDALHTVGDSPGGAPLSSSALCLRTHLAPNTPRARQRRARHSPHHKGARDAPTRGRDLSPMRESEPRVHRQDQSTHPGREKAPPDRSPLTLSGPHFGGQLSWRLSGHPEFTGGGTPRHEAPPPVLYEAWPARCCCTCARWRCAARSSTSTSLLPLCSLRTRSMIHERTSAVPGRP